MINYKTQNQKSKMIAGLCLGVLIGLTACASSNTKINNSASSKPAASKTLNPANAFQISFDWPAGMKKCFAKISPPINLINVPAGTTSLKVIMIDEDAPSFDHGGGTVNYSGGKVIPAGSLKRWQGPCPPFKHKYTFKVTALGGAKAKAKYSQNFPK